MTFLRNIINKIDSRIVIMISFSICSVANLFVGETTAAVVFVALLWIAMCYFKLCDIELMLWGKKMEERFKELAIEETFRAVMRDNMPKPPKPPGLARGSEDVL